MSSLCIVSRSLSPRTGAAGRRGAGQAGSASPRVPAGRRPPLSAQPRQPPSPVLRARAEVDTATEDEADRSEPADPHAMLPLSLSQQDELGETGQQALCRSQSLASQGHGPSADEELISAARYTAEPDAVSGHCQTLEDVIFDSMSQPDPLEEVNPSQDILSQ
jgi:hypothetical protein